MRIGIIGAGNIGGGLGRRWAEAGHEVRFGVRDPGRIEGLVAECGPRASAGTVSDAAAFGEVVVLAVPWGAALDALTAAGDLSGKVLVDTTNPLRWDDGPVSSMPDPESGAEVLARSTRGAVVKAFNTLGAEHLATGRVRGVPADVFLCSDHPDAKRTVAALAEGVGFSAVDLGLLRNARAAEQIAIAWIWLAMKGGLGRDIAFKVLRG